LAGWLLNVGRPSDIAAEGEEAGAGTVVTGEGVGVAGVVCRVAVGLLTGVAGGVLAGAGVLAGDGDRVALDRGVGEVADCPPDGSADFCSHAMTRKLAKAMRTIKRVFMRISTDA